MPGRTRVSRSRRSPSGAVAEARTLVVIDHERLQGAAWAEFHAARKRLEKATRDLHRHEEIDMPAYESWLHRTFPVQVTTLRELGEDVTAKARKIQLVQAMALRTGRSLKRLWREQVEREANPEAFRPEPGPAVEPDESTRDSADAREAFEFKSSPPPSLAARDIYRRLVQRVHPDRGGKWTAAREHLWHEIQQAWAAGDADWLARLEVDWETAHEVVGPHSPLSRLRRAIEELHAARRDTERKLSEYRRSPPWRFTRNEKHRETLFRRTEASFVHDIDYLQRKLNHLNAVIAAWEEDWTRPSTQVRPRLRRRYPMRRR